jgi:transposase
LKIPRRIAALTMVMALLVYTLAQHTLRQSLAQQGQTVPNQLGKPTATSTIRCVFQCFQRTFEKSEAMAESLILSLGTSP